MTGTNCDLFTQIVPVIFEPPCTLSVLVSRDCPGVYLLSLLYNTHKTQTSMPPAGFEPVIPACERPRTYALDRTATGIGCVDGQW